MEASGKIARVDQAWMTLFVTWRICTVGLRDPYIYCKMDDQHLHCIANRSACVSFEADSSQAEWTRDVFAEAIELGLSFTLTKEPPKYNFQNHRHHHYHVMQVRKISL